MGSQSRPADGEGDTPAARRGTALRAALFFALASVAMTWPMAVRPGAHFTGRQDFYLNLWDLDWVAHALVDPGASLWRTDRLLHPFGTGLEAQPLTLLQTVLAAPLTLSLGATVAYHLLALFAFWLAGWVTFLWVRERTGEPGAGLVAGAIFAFAPFHLAYLPELNLLPTGVVPLYLLARLHLHRRPTPARAALCGAALAVVGLASWYYGVAVGLVALALSADRLVRGSGPLRQRATSEALHWGVGAVLLVPVLSQLVPAFLEQPHLERASRAGLGWITPGLKGTEIDVGLWSWIGWTALALAALGLRPLRRSAGPLVLVLVFGVLSLGESLEVAGLRVPLPYAWLAGLPIASAARYPDRFLVLAQLGVAALAGLGALRVREWVARRGPAVARALPSALALLVLLEFWPGPLTAVDPSAVFDVPRADPGAPGAPGAIAHLPTTYRNTDGEAMFHQLRHGRPITGGYLTRPDPELVSRARSDPLLGALARVEPAALPADLAGGLRALGISHVCVQRRPLATAEAARPGRLLLPFSLAGRAFLRQRFFPDYPLHARMGPGARAWEEALAERLGAPIAESTLGVVFAVPEHE